MKFKELKKVTAQAGGAGKKNNDSEGFKILIDL